METTRVLHIIFFSKSNDSYTRHFMGTRAGFPSCRLRQVPVVLQQLLLALPHEPRPPGVAVLDRILRAVALRLGHPVPPLEDGVAEGLVGVGERRHGEAAPADGPVLREAELRRHEEAVSVEGPRVPDLEGAAPPV